MHRANESPLPQFCLLGYEPQRRSSGTSRAPFIILLVLKGKNGNLDFRVHPQWQALVHPEDSEYIDLLLADLPVRAQLNPDALFDQICSLSVGPIQTKETGPGNSDDPGLAELISMFEQV
jgi:hypothetical protein